MKVNIKITYKCDKDTNTKKIDKQIREKFDLINAFWYAEGTYLRTKIYDICYDLEIHE